MGSVYKDKKSSGCALCNPHKHGWAPKKKAKVIAREKAMEEESKQVRLDLEECVDEVNYNGMHNCFP